MESLEAFDLFYQYFKTFTLISFLVGIIGLVLVLTQLKSGNTKRKLLGIFLFAQMWMVGLIFMMLNAMFEQRAQRFLKEELAANDIQIYACGQRLEGAEMIEVHNVLKAIGNIARHHSAPTYCGTIDVKTKDKTITLRIERDNNIKTEYWIYWDKYIVTKDNPVGYVRTTKLDDMNCVPGHTNSIAY
jgi:hypothetical protein